MKTHPVRTYISRRSHADIAETSNRTTFDRHSLFPLSLSNVSPFPNAVERSFLANFADAPLNFIERHPAERRTIGVCVTRRARCVSVSA